MEQEAEVTMATVDTMTCRDLGGLVTEYVEGVLAPGERLRFERHVGRCSVCPQYIRQLRTTMHLVGRLREDTVPGSTGSDVLAAFRAWKSA